MTDEQYLDGVKKALNIPSTDTYQDDSLKEYIGMVVDFLIGSGVPRERITPYAVERGVIDLRDNEPNGGKFSAFFMQYATQLAYRR